MVLLTSQSSRRRRFDLWSISATIRASVRWLFFALHGIPVIEEEENPEMARQRRMRARVVEANTLATEYYHRKLCRDAAAAHVREYLKQRGFGIEIARAWQLGWAPPDFREFGQLAASRSMDDRLLAEAYLLGRGQRGLYPVFRDRLMFPIHNVRGEVVGFSGRVIRADQDPRKYVNTADTAAFHNSIGRLHNGDQSLQGAAVGQEIIYNPIFSSIFA